MARGSQPRQIASGAAAIETSLRAASDALEANRLDEAERGYLHALRQEPGNASAHFGLGMVASRRADFDRAVPLLVEALRLDSGQPLHWTALATTLLMAGRLAEAGTILAKFANWGFEATTVERQLAPIAGLLLDHAELLVQQGELTEAEQRLDLVITLDNGNAAAIHLAGVIAARTERLEQACVLFRLATTLDASNAGYHRDLAQALLERGEKPEALHAYERVVALDPLDAEAYSRLADLNRQRSHLQAALRANAEQIRLRPDDSDALNNRGVLLRQLGRAVDARAVFEDVLVRDPGHAIAHSNLVQIALFTDPAEAVRIAAAYGRRHAIPIDGARHLSHDRAPDRPLRIGFVSNDLREHPVARFIEPFLHHHDRTRLITVAYGTGEGDATTARLKSLFSAWRDISALDDALTAELIRADGIDILVDLAGHTGNNRLNLFAAKPAPVQVTWIGLPLTTGLTAIDYRLTDEFYDPVGTEDPHATETLWRLPGVSYCYWPDRTAPEPAARAPFQSNGFITFGCLNRLEKISPQALAVWAAILRAVPGSRLLLVVADPDEPETRADVDQRLRAADIEPQRVTLAPYSNADKFGAHLRVDIALDPFPFNGGTTSYDTLHLGVPFIALRGNQTLSRMGAAVLTVAGLPDLVADTTDDYVSIATGLAGDPARLIALRDGLRDRLRASLHMDHARHAEEVTEAFTAMWRRWCAEPRPERQDDQESAAPRK